MEARRRLAEEESPILEDHGLPGPEDPSNEERERSCLTHVPAARWCSHGLRGKSQARGHYRVNWEKYAESPPLICVDIMYMKSDSSTAEVPAGAWATILAVAGENTRMCVAVAVDSKLARNEYMHAALLQLVERTMRLRAGRVQHDSESAIKALVGGIHIKRVQDP